MENKPTKKLIFPLQVLFEDDHLAVIHKPAGIIVSGNKWKTIARALPDNLRPSQQPDACTPQPAHRLDFPTTGALLIGKTTSCIRALNQMFEAKDIHKTYLAIAIGEMKPEGNIETPIDDKPSQTEYRVVQTTLSERFGALNLVKLYPHTGRRHQLRKHLASIGHPILGDKEYGTENLILNGKGLYLHANRLEFVHPFTKEHLKIEDELPKKFKKIFP
ncbi:MAG: RluA family pseudouridine synthase [Cyclobacteriaceae bacterium]